MSFAINEKHLGWKSERKKESTKIKSAINAYFSLTSGGGGEIRTLGALRHAGFQDRCIRPLCHPSANLTVSQHHVRSQHKKCGDTVSDQKTRNILDSEAVVKTL